MQKWREKKQNAGNTDRQYAQSQGDADIAGDTDDKEAEGIHNRACGVLMHGDPVSTIFFEL